MLWPSGLGLPRFPVSCVRSHAIGAPQNDLVHDQGHGSAASVLCALPLPLLPPEPLLDEPKFWTSPSLFLYPPPRHHGRAMCCRWNRHCQGISPQRRPYCCVRVAAPQSRLASCRGHGRFGVYAFLLDIRRRRRISSSSAIKFPSSTRTSGSNSVSARCFAARLPSSGDAGARTR